MTIELLAPARDLETGLAAINCGADAVYIGAPRFGAREAAGNPLADIEQLIAYAHRYWARVYVVVNTLLYDGEIPAALEQIGQIYQAGADALILQDVGLLECALPPIPLFASTQMHNSTPERVAFLERVGFKRAILARELSLEQIREIRRQTTLELEAFIHGALCVCYSGQCYLSYAIGGRSGNRGACAQPCRNPYSLMDGSGSTLINDRHLLSIHDLNQTEHLGEMIDAGVNSFKIEGRLKDKNYVRNVVCHYRQVLDHLQVQKSSSGQVNPGFDPDPQKTFNRGYCDYFITGQRRSIGSPETPKMIGEPLGKVQTIKKDAFTLDTPADLHNADGLSFFTESGQLSGTLVNRVDGPWVTPAKMDGLSRGLMLYRNFDKAFMDRLEHSRSERRIRVEMVLHETAEGYRLELRDGDGISAAAELPFEHTPAQKPEQACQTLEKQLSKLGETEFSCSDLRIEIDPLPFLPVSFLNDLRRGAVNALQNARSEYRPQLRSAGIVPNSVPYPLKEISYLGNVLNEKAAAFYRRHGVEKIELAAESGLDMTGRKVMTTKYCLKFELGACPRHNGEKKLTEPLTLVDAEGYRLELKFNCRECVMEVFFAAKTGE